MIKVSMIYSDFGLNFDEQFPRAKGFIIEALLLLLETRKLEQISITAVCKKAGVARLTFYRHFKSKETVLETVIEIGFRTFEQELLRQAQDGNIDISLAFFEFFRKNKKIIDLLIRSEMESLLLQYFSQYLPYLLENPRLVWNKNRQLDGYGIQFWAGGLYNVLINWIKNNCRQSPEEMALIIEEMAGYPVSHQG